MIYHTVRDTKPFRPGLVTRHRKLAILLNLSWLLALGLWAGASSLWWPSAATAAQGELDARPLELGKPIERELAGGGSHIYQITLAEGQYLSVTIEQRGIDVVVQLLGPDGKRIMEFDSEIRNQGQETVSQVAEVAGSHRLTVQANQKGAPAGRYVIRVTELRASTEKDRALSEARKSFTESRKLYLAGKYDEARHLVEQVLEIRERALESEHPDVGHTLHLLAILHRSKSDYGKAETTFQRALVIREKALGPDHPDVAATINLLGLLYQDKGDHAKAELLYQRSLAINEKALGPDHPDVAISLHNLANLHRNGGNYAEAEPLYQRALDIWEKALGPDHPDVARALNNFAILYRERYNFSKAEPLFQRALAVREKALGVEHPDVAFSLNGLAVLHREKGDYVKAEPLYQRALNIRERTLGAEHPEVAVSINNLANLYINKGDYARAELLHLRALDIREKALGPEHPYVATSLNNLAILSEYKGDYAKAESLHQRALGIRKKALGPDHPDVADSLNNLGSLHYHKGDYDNAESLYQRALTINQKALGPEDPSIADRLHNLALIYQLKGEYEKAEPLYQRALAITEGALGLWHPDVADCLNNLAKLHLAKGETGEAVTFQSRACAVSERNLTLNLAADSERQKLAYLATLAEQADQIVSLHAHSAPNNQIARSLATTSILQRKGRVLDAMFDDLSTLRRRFSAQDQALFNQLNDTNAQLARLVLGGPRRVTPAAHQKQIEALAEQKEKYEAEISRHSAEFRVQSQPITVEAVRSAIPAGAAVIEFFTYRPFNAKYTKPAEAFGQLRYVAYVLRRQGEPQWAELGEAKVIDDAVAAWRKALRDPKRGDIQSLARQVDDRVMRPVRALLGDTRRVFISPDGMLNLIPFAALVDERNQYLVERYSFSYLTSGRDLLRLQERLPSKPEPVIVADPVFGERAGVNLAQRRDVEVRPDPQPSTTQSGILDRIHFPRLAATAGEAQALKVILPQATVFTRQQATEAALKRLSSPRILHIATHGFFLEDTETKLANTRDVVLLGDGPAGLPTGLGGAQLQNPLLRSGLALAGANLRQSGPNQEDDGVLTAMEVAGLDLWGTKLVVLSACDTGVGEVKNGEGVYGLRRALVLAGSETQVMSLWPVSDAGTRDLMIEYYKALQRGEGRSEGLRQVQLQMLRSKNRRHPFYWASFIQSGEWANLAGQR